MVDVSEGGVASAGDVVELVAVEAVATAQHQVERDDARRHREDRAQVLVAVEPRHALCSPHGSDHGPRHRGSHRAART
jgi:hypothetical protein